MWSAMTPAANRQWIDLASYFGPNRRGPSKALRVRERRREDLSGPAPSLNVALRKLRLQVFNVCPGPNAAMFAERVLGVAIIAAEANAPEVQLELEGLANRILARPHVDWRSALYRELDDLSIETYALH